MAHLEAEIQDSLDCMGWNYNHSYDNPEYVVTVFDPYENEHYPVSSLAKAERLAKKFECQGRHGWVEGPEGDLLYDFGL